MKVKIADIKIGPRHRKSMGDIEGLAASITDVGLLHPPVVTPAMTLVVGARRIAAAKILGWTEIEVSVASDLDDAYRLLKAERDENTCREQPPATEDHALYLALLEAEQVFAKERQEAGQKAGGGDHRSEKAKADRSVGTSHKAKPEPKSRDRAAKATGRSEKTHRKISEVVKAAEEDPDLTPLVEEMDRTGKVDGVHRKLKHHRAQAAARAQAASAPVKPTLCKSDAVAWLGTIAPESVDLLLTDPPYSTDIYYGDQRDTSRPTGIEVFARSWIPAALRTVKPTGRAYICTGAYPQELHAYLSVLLEQSKFLVANVLVWTYRNTLGPSPKLDYKLNWQAVFYLRGPAAPPLACPEMVEQFSVQDINAPDGRQGNRDHAWQKPDELAARFVRHGSTTGDIVIDPFAGTGTFLLAATRLGRIARGCDCAQKMIDLAVKRGCVVAE